MANTANPQSTPAEDEHQSHFAKTFIVVFGALFIFTFFCIFMARMLGAPGPADSDGIVRAGLMERIAPVGQVRTSAEEAVVAVAAAPQSGEEVVQGVCAACHASGVANAPKLDDIAAWEERRALGLDTLLASVINGKGAMAARAGTTLSDEELKAAVIAMAGFEASDAAAAPAEESAAVADDDAAAVSETETSEASTEEEAAVSTATAVAATVVTAEVSARVKGIADTVCAACHIAGVAGAPKIGDTEAWALRAEKGMDAQVAVVVTGKGAMPARGGSDLSDEELASAITYMMSK